MKKIFVLILIFWIGFGHGQITFDVLEYGAAGDGKTDDSKAFLRAWGELCGAADEPNGVPTVVIPEMKAFLLQPIKFRGPCNSNGVHVQKIFVLILIFWIGFGHGQITFDVLEYGAAGDGKTDDSKAFLKAWAELCGAADEPNGVPTLVIPKMKAFLLQPIKFRGPCNSNGVHVQASALLVEDVKYIDFEGTSANEEAIKLDCDQNSGCRNIIMDRIKITSAVPDKKIYASCNNAIGTSIGTIVPNVPCLKSGTEPTTSPPAMPLPTVPLPATPPPSPPLPVMPPPSPPVPVMPPPSPPVPVMPPLVPVMPPPSLLVSVMPPPSPPVPVLPLPVPVMPPPSPPVPVIPPPSPHVPVIPPPSPPVLVMPPPSPPLPVAPPLVLILPATPPPAPPLPDTPPPLPATPHPSPLIPATPPQSPPLLGMPHQSPPLPATPPQSPPLPATPPQSSPLPTTPPSSPPLPATPPPLQVMPPPLLNRPHPTLPLPTTPPPVPLLTPLAPLVPTPPPPTPPPIPQMSFTGEPGVPDIYFTPGASSATKLHKKHYIWCQLLIVCVLTRLLFG
ncbi:hypothetical protein L3X38_036484 [Prunus dulcis]|uniref:Pectin lyase-like superfamily protein n=1 Tax=Prunus dulcis TaxID=3755 RepID=A0AAD4YNM5_PRUDU|nr:hypothetical protein L3X38_036484 [Prunus dulcis]